MKLFLVITLLLISGLVSAGESIGMKFTQSAELKDTITSLENHYDVSCGQGKIRTIFPKVFGQVAYVTYCAHLTGIIKVRISASFKDSQNPVFALNSIKVKRIKGSVGTFLGLEEADLSSDPFIEAYKRSALVRDLRHYVEDTYKVICKSGSAKRGSLWGKANYFYTVKCDSDTVSIKLKVKSKVQVIGDETFKFNLSKYKVIF